MKIASVLRVALLGLLPGTAVCNEPPAGYAGHYPREEPGPTQTADAIATFARETATTS